jgi:hypothetical protein
MEITVAGLAALGFGVRSELLRRESGHCQVGAVRDCVYAAFLRGAPVVSSRLD